MSVSMECLVRTFSRDLPPRHERTKLSNSFQLRSIAERQKRTFADIPWEYLILFEYLIKIVIFFDRFSALNTLRTITKN